jgi:hypothetical protein
MTAYQRAILKQLEALRALVLQMEERPKKRKKKKIDYSAYLKSKE